MRIPRYVIRIVQIYEPIAERWRVHGRRSCRKQRCKDSDEAPARLLWRTSHSARTVRGGRSQFGFLNLA